MVCPTSLLPQPSCSSPWHGAAPGLGGAWTVRHWSMQCTVHAVDYRIKQSQQCIVGCVFTRKCVSTLISEIPYCLQQLVFGHEAVEIPLCARVSTVLGQTWVKNISLHKITFFTGTQVDWRPKFYSNYWSKFTFTLKKIWSGIST